MPNEFEYIITEEQKGERIDHFLAGQKEIDLTRSQVHRLIEDGYVEVNNETPKASYKIKYDDHVIIKIPPPQELEVKPENIPLDIIYQDKDVVVVNKPRGMVSHAVPGHFSGTLVNALLYHCHDLSGIGGVMRPGIVHRLDKDTSGLIVVAKSDAAHRSLAEQFSSRKVVKKYLALVHGVVKEDTGVIAAKIGRHPRHRKKMAIIRETRDEEGGTKAREALTRFKVVERFKDYTLLDVELETGRTHQIRVHLTSIGHSIVGDPTYGHRKEEFRLNGQLLHAEKLGFTHPQTGQYVEFSAEMPEDMKRVINILESR